MATNNLAYNNFDRNIKSASDLINLHSVIVEKMPLVAGEAEEILRASIALSVGAFDNFLHDFYRSEIVESYIGTGNFQIQFDKIKISIEGLKNIDNSKNDNEKRNYLSQELRKIQRSDSYQSPRSVENLFIGLNLKNVWTKIEEQGLLKMKSKDIKAELANIIDRRNKIVHESDWDYINDQKYNIENKDAYDVLQFILSLVKSINSLQPEKNLKELI